MSMAFLYPSTESATGLASQDTAYWNPFLTEAYQTMIPSRSCFTASLARVTRLEEEAEPLAPSKMVLVGALTLMGKPGERMRR